MSIVHIVQITTQLTTLNGALNILRGSSSVKTSVLHNNISKHWYTIMQKSNYQLSTIYISQMGVIKYKKKRKKVQGAWCMVHDMGIIVL